MRQFTLCSILYRHPHSHAVKTSVRFKNAVKDALYTERQPSSWDILCGVRENSRRVDAVQERGYPAKQMWRHVAVITSEKKRTE